ncbi:MAG: histidine kinase, partial [Bacteroidota bacterium]
MPNNANLLDQFFQSRVATHTAFWIVLLVFLPYYSSLFSGSFLLNLAEMVIMLPLQMTATYLLVYWQLPRLLYQKHWVLFLISFLTTVYFFSTLSRLTNIYIVEPLTGYEGYDESLWEVLSDPLYLLKAYAPLIYAPAILFLIFKMVKDRFQQESRLNLLEKEKRTAELNFLKAQMNPHFLFNTLNNIYALSKEGAEETPEMILKL